MMMMIVLCLLTVFVDDESGEDEGDVYDDDDDGNESDGEYEDDEDQEQETDSGSYEGMLYRCGTNEGTMYRCNNNTLTMFMTMMRTKNKRPTAALMKVCHTGVIGTICRYNNNNNHLTASFPRQPG